MGNKTYSVRLEQQQCESDNSEDINQTNQRLPAGQTNTETGSDRDVAVYDQITVRCDDVVCIIQPPADPDPDPDPEVSHYL
ncbi:uncharacterized protein V6R79_009000 [Siganus canaliculatus]